MQELQPWNALHMHMSICLKVQQEFNGKGEQTAIYFLRKKTEGQNETQLERKWEENKEIAVAENSRLEDSLRTSGTQYLNANEPMVYELQITHRRTGLQ